MRGLASSSIWAMVKSKVTVARGWIGAEPRFAIAPARQTTGTFGRDAAVGERCYFDHLLERRIQPRITMAANLDLFREEHR